MENTPLDCREVSLRLFAFVCFPFALNGFVEELFCVACVELFPHREANKFPILSPNVVSSLLHQT